MYIKNVKCPKCNAEVMFDDFVDCYDTEADPCDGIYIERVVYTCPECGEDFTGKIFYDLTIKRVETD
jgi:DNA-directed RNA polymerase subunit RPC12/RpoP